MTVNEPPFVGILKSLDSTNFKHIDNWFGSRYSRYIAIVSFVASEPLDIR
jgi:hypothetical protein